MQDRSRPAALLASLLAALFCTTPIWNGWYADRDMARPFIHGRQWSVVASLTEPTPPARRAHGAT